MRWFLGLGVVGVVFCLLLLVSASENSPLFPKMYPLLFLVNGLLVLALAVYVGRQIYAISGAYRRGTFGSRLTGRLVGMLIAAALLPGMLVYSVSVLFVAQSVDTWFNVRVEKALDAGLILGRSTLDHILIRMEQHAQQVWHANKNKVVGADTIEPLRSALAVDTVALFSAQGDRLWVANKSDIVASMTLTSEEMASLSRRHRFSSVTVIEHGGWLLRVIMPVALDGSTGGFLLVQDVLSDGVRQPLDNIETVSHEYKALLLSHGKIKWIYGLTLTLAFLLALLLVIAAGVYFSRRLASPLSLLAEGTQAVSQGDFSPRVEVGGGDELAILTRSFNQMMRQLTEARDVAELRRIEVESARSYLENVLSALTAGVLTFDLNFVLISLNKSAQRIFGDSFEGMETISVREWARQQEFAHIILEEFAHQSRASWRQQFVRIGATGQQQYILVKGALLGTEPAEGYVVVFDDVTQLVHAQRLSTWGEVAQRLAHEIKNPLTPIQLSAERLQHKLIARLSDEDARILVRATDTIVAQVQSMKNMVNEFRDFARLPTPQRERLDLNGLVREVLHLYDSLVGDVQCQLMESLPDIDADKGLLRQVLHNLLQNAQDAVSGVELPCIQVRTTLTADNLVELMVVDNGCGFSVSIMPKAFEPYVTSKPKGTGLGLAIVRKIIDEHGGDIFLENVLPAGAAVRIIFARSKLQQGEV